MKFNQWVKLGGKILKSNFGPLKYPYKLTYVVTKECHSKCLNCDIWKVKPKDELSLAEIRLLARNSPFFSWIDFTGGEPTDRQDFVEVVEAFLQNARDLLLVHFPTNGLKPKRIIEVCNELRKLRPPRLVVTVSIDGPPEVNDRLRGIPRDFERAVETFSELRALGVATYIGMTLYQENVKLIDETVSEITKRVPKFSYRDIHVNLPHISAHYYGNTTAAPRATTEMAEAIERFINKKGVPTDPFSLLERSYQRRIRRYLETSQCPQHCAALMASCFLSETGMVYPCNIWDAPLGNIRDNNYSLMPILRSAKAVELREALYHKNCPNCWTPCEAYQTIFANLFR